MSTMAAAEVQRGKVADARATRIPLPQFFAILFAISWIGTIPMVLGSYGADLPAPVKLLQLLMLFGPGLAACFAAYANEGSAGVKQLLRGLLRWRIHPLLYLAVLAGPALLFAASLVLANLSGATALALPSAGKFLSTFATTFGVYLLLNTEEIAWRGYALPRLQARMGVFRATLVLAALWLLFHLPLFWIKGGHPAGYPFWMFTLMILGMSLPFTAAYNAGGGSILIVHLLHQSFNAAVEAVPVFPAVAHSLAPMLIAVGFFYGATFLIAAVLRKRGAEFVRSTM